MNNLKQISSGIALLVMTATIAGCNNTSGPSDGLTLKSHSKPATLVTSLAKTAQHCWFKSKDKTFHSYRLAVEVNSYAGRPRFLLVPKSDPGALPLLVVQAESKGSKTSGKYAALQTYGPLLSGKHGKRITSDIERWANGNTACNS